MPECGPENFDLYQFYRPALPVAASTRISYEDFQRGMHTKTKVSPLYARRWIPAWAMCDEKFRAVIRARVANYLYGKIRKKHVLAANLEGLKRMVREQTERVPMLGPKAPTYQKEMVKAHKRAVRRPGGYVALLTAIAYQRYRLGQNSVEIAAEVGINPANVRQHLYRLNLIARKLFPHDCCAPHWSRAAA